MKTDLEFACDTMIQSLKREYNAIHVEWIRNDPEWRSALMILMAPVFEGAGVMSFVDLSRRRIDFPTLLLEAGAQSHGEQILIKLAAHLFNGSVGQVDINEAACALDADNWPLFVTAIRLRRSYPRDR